MVTNWDFEDSLVSGRRPSVFRFSVFIRFYSFLPFDAIWPARQGRLPCLGREGCRRRFAFDLHIEMIQIRPFGLKFCLRPAGTLSFFVFSFSFVFIRFYFPSPSGACAQDRLRPAGRPFVFRFFHFFVFIHFISFYFVFSFFSFLQIAQTG